METQRSPRRDGYGHRARIGYVCPPSVAEIVPYEFYKIVPAGVTLAISTLTVTAPRSPGASRFAFMNARRAPVFI